MKMHSLSARAALTTEHSHTEHSNYAPRLHFPSATVVIIVSFW